MLRTFAEHDIRLSEPLDGFWDFATEADRQGPRGKRRSFPRRIAVPSAWETMPGLESYRGTGWLRTDVSAVDGMALRLVFGGVSHTGTALLDGRRVGRHYDAFTPWNVVVPGLKEGRHELVMEVDNSFGPHSALHLPNDYHTYGGITRPVEMQFIPPLFIERMHARPVRTRRGERWDLDVRIWLRNWSRARMIRRLVVGVAGAVHDFGRITVDGRATRELRRTLVGLEAEAWTAETPALYFLEACLFEGDKAVDDLCDRIGFRQVEVRGRQVLLNRRPLHLRGYNRHEDHGCFGCALPVEAMTQDLQILRDLGCNFVRTSHYPNDRRFLDLCDEEGFYVWEESHARQVKFDHPAFRQQIADSTREMVEWHFNHPSIVIWGCLNECDTITPAGRDEHRRVLKLLRRLDPSRPTTYAAHHRKRDTCLGLADIVSWNLYTGWYSDRPEDTAKVLNDLIRWKESARSRGGRGKPLILSEFGAAGLYGHRNPRICHWSEEYQAKVLDENLKVYLNHPAVMGVAVWQFCDVRITNEGDKWMTRPRTMNNKGTVDEFRRPKLAYETVKRRMLEAKRRWL
jgi:beta-glucuronidase